MKKLFLILLCSIAVLFLLCFALPNQQGQPSQNTPELVSTKLRSLYGVDFEYTDSISNSEGNVVHQFYSCIEPNLLVSASYCYASDSFYIFPFARSVVFRDDLVEQIRYYHIKNTFGSSKVRLSDDGSEVDGIAERIAACLEDIRHTYYSYGIDENLNPAYITIDFILDNGDIRPTEFSETDYENAKRKVLRVLNH